jgi:hypothetical protein
VRLKKSQIWDGGLAQVVEHLPNKHKALSSISSIAKKKSQMLHIFAHMWNLDQVDEGDDDGGGNRT